MILVDTSVWIDHLRAGVPRLADELESENVLMHPFVLGEIACGSLARRAEALYLLSRLPRATLATDKEAMLFIEQRHLMGRGIGYIDVHLLASVTLEGSARIWTRDKRLGKVADELGLAASET